MVKMMGGEPEGSRKVILTKWMLVIFALGTVGYFILLGLNNSAPPESFFMNFMLGLGAIGGAFTVGNIFEHRAKAQTETERERKEAEVSKATAEKERARAEADKAASEAKKAEAEVSKTQAKKPKAA
jgi:flagellar basal body-associated protein FliL